MAHVLRSLLSPKVKLTLDLPATPVWVEAEPTQFDVALLNLAVNARDASQKSGDEVILSLKAVDVHPASDATPERRVAVRVRDFGTGIAPDVLPRILEPFYTTKEEGVGTGMGLAQVHAFVLENGGELKVDSAPGLGSTFTILLPLRRQGAADQHSSR